MELTKHTSTKPFWFPIRQTKLRFRKKIKLKTWAFMSCQNKLSKQIKWRTLLHSSKIYMAHLIPKLVRLNTAKPIIGFWSFCIYFSHSHNHHIVHIHYIHVLHNWLKRLISFICSTLNNAIKQVTSLRLCLLVSNFLL